MREGFSEAFAYVSGQKLMNRLVPQSTVCRDCRFRKEVGLSPMGGIGNIAMSEIQHVPDL
jgi:hypothetical protein